VAGRAELDDNSNACLGNAGSTRAHSFSGDAFDFARAGADALSVVIASRDGERIEA